MGVDRRTVLAAGLAASLAGPAVAQTGRTRLIATEEAFTLPELVEPMRAMLAKGGSNLDLPLLRLIYGKREPDTPPPTPGSRDAIALRHLPDLLDVSTARLADMDENGVDVQLLSIGMPGVQVFPTAEAIALARIANDRLRAAIDAHPTRFAGLACFAPQAPMEAAREMERAIRQLRLSGFIVNSHTDNLYLDDSRFVPILEAAEALDAPLYIHPRAVGRDGRTVS